MLSMLVLTRTGIKFMVLWGFVSAMLLLASRPVAAAPTFTTRYVTTSGYDWGNSSCSLANPCRTIGYAIGVAQAGDVVSVAAGTYVGNVQVSKNLTIRGAGVDQTIVDGAANGSVFTIKSGVNVHIQRLRIRNGKAAQGGGIYIAASSTLRVKRVTLSDNQANSGGGISNYGTLKLIKVTLYRNHGLNNTGGGLTNKGSATLDRTNIQQNDAQIGAAIYSVGDLTIGNSAIFGNTSPTGSPGIYNYGTLTMTNATISGNTSSSTSAQGGAIYQYFGSTTLNYVTITGNTQAYFGAIFAKSGTVLTLNSIIHGNGANPQCGPYIEAFSSGFSVLADQSCSFWPDGGGALANPELLSLTNNGGYTPTHALKPSSPAIDLVPQDKCINHDQRFVARPIDGNGDGQLNCDAGAYEYKP